MTYDFRNLSFLDFEDLARDLIGRELALRFEAFCAGPDGGMDGRHATADGTLSILQAKHYAGSSIFDLKRSIKQSLHSIDSINPSRYILATSCGLTPRNKSDLAALIGTSRCAQSDIFGPEDLNALLRNHRDIEQANVKLWLSSAAVLDRMINAARHAVTKISRGEIEIKVRVYAPNPSFKEARDKLEAGHVVIISGPPGVGKTTLAEMLSFAYIADSWEYVTVRSLDDGFAKLDDSIKQIFFFDDFLGTAALDTRALATKDSDIARFIKRVRAAPNARFVLTTRAPIFEEARRVSERLADKSLDIAKYVLDVGIYTRRIKARILYNHLLVSGMPLEHIRALWSSGAVPKIVDHRNYNPRIIEAMTDGVQVQGVVAADYPAEFLKALNNPHRIWDVSFRSHIQPRCRHLLYSLFFCSDFGCELDELRTIYNGLHQYVARKYSIPHDPSDFEEALQILEGGYINIRDQRISLINPSLRDYLSDYLDDVDLICDLAFSAEKADWVNRVWYHVRITKLWSPERQARVALSCRGIAGRFPDLADMKKVPDRNAWSYYDSGYAERVELLLSWFACSDDQHFADIALSIIQVRSQKFEPWRDGRKLIGVFLSVKDGEYGSLRDEALLFEGLKGLVLGLLLGHIWPDDLEGMYEDIEKRKKDIGSEIVEAADEAMYDQIKQAHSFVEGMDSESDLADHRKSIERIARRLSVPQPLIDSALSAVDERIERVGHRVEEASPPTFSSSPVREKEKFDDKDLENLFAPLVHGMK